MNRQKLFDGVLHERMIAVVREESADAGLRVARTLAGAGARIIEVTFTTPSAVAIIEELASSFKHRGVIIAGGSIRSAADAALARRAGADVIVSPHTSREVIEYAGEHDMLCIAGALTATEVVTAWEAGAGIVKIFPAPLAGGPAYIRALRQPIRDVPLLAGGPVSLDSITSYLDAGAVAVNLGTSLAPPELVERGDWNEIARRVSLALATIQSRQRPLHGDAAATATR